MHATTHARLRSTLAAYKWLLLWSHVHVSAWTQTHIQHQLIELNNMIKIKYSSMRTHGVCAAISEGKMFCRQIYSIFRGCFFFFFRLFMQINMYMKSVDVLCVGSVEQVREKCYVLIFASTIMSLAEPSVHKRCLVTYETKRSWESTVDPSNECRIKRKSNPFSLF